MSLSTIKAILFDKDGTLIDFNKTWLPPYLQAAEYLARRSDGAQSAAWILAQGGYREADQSWQPDSLLAAGSNQQIIEHWNTILQSPLDATEEQEVRDFFKLDPQRYVPVVEPIRSCLQQFVDRGIKLGIATMDNEQQAISLAAQFGVDDLFTFYCGADSGYGVKPEPGMLNAFAEHTGVAAKNVAMVGDSPRDIQMGINAGAAMSIAVLTGAHDAIEMGRHTDHVLQDIGGIAGLIGLS